MHTQKKLFTPIQIGPITLKHRVVMPPMSRLRAQWSSGIPSDLQLEYYRQRASDGGLIDQLRRKRIIPWVSLLNDKKRSLLPVAHPDPTTVAASPSGRLLLFTC